MMQLAYYTAPETVVITVRTEQGILSNSYNSDRNQTPRDTGDVDF